MYLFYELNWGGMVFGNLWVYCNRAVQCCPNVSVGGLRDVAMVCCPNVSVGILNEVALVGCPNVSGGVLQNAPTRVFRGMDFWGVLK
jgi:hypothetical protein